MNFSIEKKGYNISEVDAFVEELTAKYHRLQAQNSELEQKLATAKRLIRRFSDTENALKQNIADSKRAAAYMISDARDRSEELLDSARESCGEIISDLDMQIAERMNTVENMKAEVAAFKNELFGLYTTHIELIDKLALVADSFEYQPDYAPVADAVDKFEEGAELPEFETDFVEYPEESLFSEFNEEEKTEAEPEATVEEVAAYVEAEEETEEPIETAEIADAEEQAEPVTAEEEPPFYEEEDAEEDDLDQLVLDQAAFDAAVEFDFDSFVLDAEESEEFSDSEEAEEADAAEEISEDIDREDYLKFLAEFANSDDLTDI
ncbi:MAG: DivIVA domain-containing protein [Clostridia bacterium]|nr:DivIVA domain-containing protein [Clostridia bacterium]